MEIIVELKISTNLKRPILVDPTIMIKVFLTQRMTEKKRSSNNNNGSKNNDL